MKKVLIICLLSLLIVGSLCADWQRVIGLSESPIPPVKDVMKSDTSGLFIRTTVFGFTKEDTTVDEKDFQRIEITEEYIDTDTIRAGKPQIPYIKLLIAVPDSCEFNITAYESDYTLFEDYLLYPVPRVVFEDSGGCTYLKEVFAYDTSFYEKDTLYPDKFYEVNSDGHWRDQHVLEVFLYPVQFNPQKKLMYFYHGIDLRIEYTGTVVENENGLGPFEDIGREILLNYPGIDRDPGREVPPAVHYYTDLLDTNNVADYIIVTHYDFLNNKTTSGWIQDFAEWRVDHNQFDVGIVKMQDIYTQFPSITPDSAAQLRDFLIYAYNNWRSPSMPDDHFAYCLFIGDWDYVPTRLYLVTPWWLAADEHYFRDLSSPPDNWEDIMLGRWPAKETNVQDLVTIAQKTINYESEPDVGPNVLNWRRRGLLIDGENYGLIWQAKPYFTDIGYDKLTVRRIGLTQQEYKDSITHYLNQGEILTLYSGHGGPNGWMHYNSDELINLKNEDRLPVVLSFACQTASFQYDRNSPGWKCFGENFIFKSKGGAVGFHGATVVTFSSSLRDGLSILNNMLRYQNWILGKCLVNLEYKKHFCLLGDPVLDLGDYTALPDYPDLVVRPRGIDISPLSPYPYPTTNGVIPIGVKVWNIGGIAAYNVDVKFQVIDGGVLIYDSTVTIDTILSRDATTAKVYWNTRLTHPDIIGDIGNIKFYAEVDPNDVIDESWEYNNASSAIKKVVLYPPGWSKKITPPFGVKENVPAIANLDGEGSVEIVCPGFDSIYVFDPEGNLVSPWPKYFREVYGIVLGDIDHNERIEIIAVSPDSIKVYDYQGNILSGWPVSIHLENYQFTGLPSLGRIEPEVSAVLNVVVAAKTTLEDLMPMKILVYNYQGSRIYKFDSDVDVTHTCRFYGLSIGKVVSGGNDEIVISYLDKVAQQPPSTEIFNCNGLVDTLNYFGRMISALVDIDNDGYADVITGCSDAKMRAYNANTQTQLWLDPPLTGGPIKSSPAVGDINPALDTLEIAFGNNASRIYAIRDATGYWWPLWPYETEGMIQSSPALARLEGETDTYVDIVTGAHDLNLYALDWDKTPISPYPLPLFGIPNSVVIGDIDGDTKSEVIFTSDDGYLHVWENINSYVPPYTLEWPQFHHDYQRTGLYGW